MGEFGFPVSLPQLEASQGRGAGPAIPENPGMTANRPVPLFKACVDVDYREQEAVCACLLFERWGAERPAQALVERAPLTAPYVPGQFYRRELPGLLATLRPVLPVARSASRGASAVAVRRGPSGRPLYVMAAGLDAEAAAGHIRAMHGEYRLPTLLRQVDQLCRRA